MHRANRFKRLGAPGLTAAALIWTAPAVAAPLYTADLGFNTATRQSAWGPGPAQRLSDSIFLGTTWSNKSVSVGGVTGGVSRETAPNPAYALWVACKGATLGLGDCGSEPSTTATATIDTRTGAEATLKTSGKAGVNLNYTLDAGSVGASVGYAIEAKTPDAVKKGEFFSLGVTESLKTGALDGQSPTASASADIVFALEVDASGRACIVFAGCASGSGRIVDFDTTTEIIAIDPNKISFAAGLLPANTSLEVALANVKATVNVDSGIPPAIPPSVSVDVNGLTIGKPPVGVVVDVASAEITVPNVVSTGGLSGGQLKAGGSDRILALKADVDAIAPFVPVGGAGFSVGPLGVTLDAFDIEAGPTMSLFQEFTLIPELMVDFVFDRPVFASGFGLLDSWSGAWDALPDFAVNESTLFMPTFWLDATLKSKTGLQFGLELTLELVKASLGVGPASFNVGPLVDFNLNYDPSFAQVSLIDRSFAFGGFNRIQGASFRVAPVPLPLPGLLLAVALAGLALRGRCRSAAA